MTSDDTQSLVFETRARGKLLLTGEYFVLDGAQALALPVCFGQSLRAEVWKEKPARLFWTSQKNDGTAWFLAEYELPGLVPIFTTDPKAAATLTDMIAACRRQNPAFLAGDGCFKVLTQNDFPREWGLGTSSTLIAALARWANVDPYRVLFDTMGGSGYDIACAYAQGPILYRLLADATPEVRPVRFQPTFANALYFIFLNQKQDSREGIRRYRQHALGDTALVAAVSQLTAQFLAADTLAVLDAVIREHEALISDALGLPRAKGLYCSDFWGEIKSLGAWGGDFVLATSSRPDAEMRAYFLEKGFDTVLSWAEMVGEQKNI